jgi:hypothetical protein
MESVNLSLTLNESDCCCTVLPLVFLEGRDGDVHHMHCFNSISKLFLYIVIFTHKQSEVGQGYAIK